MSPDRRHRRERDPVKNRAHQARHRERVKKCRRSYRCDADGPVLDMLVARKYLGPDETGDDAAVGLAITVFLLDHAKLDQA